MATLAKLYPILKDLGLENQKANEFVEIIDQSRKEELATKEDIKYLEHPIGQMDHWVDDSSNFHKHRFVEILLTFLLEKLENIHTGFLVFSAKSARKAQRKVKLANSPKWTVL